jgi:hypothetical protein
MTVSIPVFDVRAYGARGDGRTPHETAAIQAAMDAAAAAPSGVVYVPAGTYLTGATLVLRGGATLHLAGGATIEYQAPGDNALVIAAGCAVRGQSATTSMLRCSRRGNGIIVANGCVISDLGVFGDQGSGGEQASGITGGHAADVIVERCVIANWYAHGLNAGGASARWTINDNVVHDCAIDGIYSGHGSDNFIITNNHLYNVGSNGVDLNGSGHIVTNNRLQHIGFFKSDTQSDFWGILLQPLAGTDASGNIIANNRLDDVRGPAIALCGFPGQSCSENVVTGNVITRSAAGVVLDPGGLIEELRRGICNHNIVANNVVRDAAGSGIYLFGHHATDMSGNLVASNVCSGSGHYGIELDGGHPTVPALRDTIVRDNVLLGNQLGPLGIVNEPLRTTIAGNKTRVDTNAHETFDTPIRLGGSPHSANKVLFIDSYDGGAEPHALYPDTDPHTLTVQPSGGHKMLVHGGRGAVNLEPTGSIQIAGQTVVGPRLPGIPTIVNSPGESYGQAEQRMLVELAATVNALIARLNATTGHGLIA